MSEQLELTDVPHSHPIVNGRVLLPDMLFVARNRVSGQCQNFVYFGHMGVTASGEHYVDCRDIRGNCRSIAVDSITQVRPAKRKRAA